MSREPSIRELRAIVESAGAELFEDAEELLYPPVVYDGEGNEHPYDIYLDVVANKQVGDTVTSSAGAPGIGHATSRITRIDDTGVYGVEIENNIRVPDGAFYEAELDQDPECSYCDDEEPLDGVPCLNCGSLQYVDEDEKPYATMDDGPDKYLFRKDGKQKLVGSADNEPENGEEELEETDMDKFIKEMQIAAGIIVAEDEAIEEETVDEETVDEEEAVEEGKLPDALKKHQFGANDDDDSDDDSDNDKDDDKEEVDEDVSNWMKRFDRLSPTVNEEGKPWEDDDVKELKDKMDDKRDDDDKETVDEDCDESENAEKNDDGDCSPFTHADDNVDMVREDDGLPDGAIDAGWYGDAEYDSCEECSGSGMSTDPYGPEGKDCKACGGSGIKEDLLLAPPGDVGPGVDEDDIVYGREGKGKSYGPGDFDKFDMREEPNDDERIIDVGDDVDFETYDFDNEFEAMLGGSSDPVGGGQAGSMYEMNDLRRLAGLEQILEEEECDEEEASDDDKDDDKEELDEVTDVEEEVIKEHGSDVVAYDIVDERAYYLMADILGAELDFGPEDEILVPSERNDEICAELTKQGFEQGRDFTVAGEQYESDLQNGYNDRKFSDGQDYFPKGATNQPATDLGPTASGQTDNPMSNKMRSVEKDEVYETMKLAYRRHRKS